MRAACLRIQRFLVQQCQARFCWPTPAGWVLLAAAGATFVLATIVPMLSICIFSALLWGLVLASIAMALGSLGPVTVSREFTADGTVGQPLSMALFLRSHGRLPCYGVLVMEDCPFSHEPTLVHAVPRLAAREELRLPRSVLAARRGAFQLGEVRLRGGDPAGLFFRQRRQALPADLLIYPEALPIDYLPLRLQDRVIAAAIGQVIGASGQGQEFFGVREYRPTDGVRVIHWKASAKQRKLMVREFEETSINQVTILLDISAAHVSEPADSSNLEYLIRLTTGMLRYLSGFYCRVLLQVGSGTEGRRLIGPSQSVATEGLIMLAQLQAGVCQPAAQVGEVFAMVPPRSIVYVLSLHEPASGMEMLQAWQQQGVNLRWLVAPAATFSGQNAPAEAPRTTRAGHHGPRPMVLHPQGNPAMVLAHG